MPLSHQFHDQKASGIAYDLFADAGRSCSTDIVVHVEPGANDGAVADAATHLPRHTACGTGAGEIATLINCQHADGVVIAGSSRSVDIRGLLAVILVLTIRDGLVSRFLAPFLPG